ncbi:MAG: peptidase S45, partial [Bacteroidetes bacterium QS_8_64_10]
MSAESEHDRYAALGYVHGRARPWPMMLWRQAALGRLGEWFGPSALEVDSLSRKLGFAALAQRTYDGLSAEQKASLRAYTSGLNAALDGPAPQLDQEITLLDVQPASWKPWHTLALERLFAWLSAAPPPADSLRNASPQVRAFFRADRDLRKLLHLHNFQQSAAWAVRDSAGTRL